MKNFSQNLLMALQSLQHAPTVFIVVAENDSEALLTFERIHQQSGMVFGPIVKAGPTAYQASILSDGAPSN